MMIRATLGNASWDVLHQGMALHLPISIGTAVILMSLVVLLFWIPLREPPGLGTIANSFAVGLAADLTLSLLNAPDALWQRGCLMVGGVVLNALATALYIGSQFGPGPRDGLMTGLHRRTGVSIRLVRTGLEVIVVVIGGCRRCRRPRHCALRRCHRAAGAALVAVVHRQLPAAEPAQDA